MIGIMSDSHDNVHAVKYAVRFFNDCKCSLVIHAGDFIAPFAALELDSLNCQVKAVFGNCDGEKKGLANVISTFGEIKEAPFIFSYKNLRFLLTHVDFPIKSYLAKGTYDIIVYGHTHKPDITTKKNTILINPGESGGWVSGKCTVALLDPKKLEAEIVHL